MKSVGEPVRFVTAHRAEPAAVAVVFSKAPCSYVSYSLNSLKGGYMGYIGYYYRGY